MNSNEEFRLVESRNPELILQEIQSLDRNEQRFFDEDLNILSKENYESRDQHGDEKNIDISHVGTFVAEDDVMNASRENSTDVSIDIPDLAFNSTFDKDVDEIKGSISHEDDKCTKEVQLSFFLYLIIFGFISLLLLVNVYVHLRFSMHPEISWTGTGEIDLLSSSECQRVFISLSGSSTCNPCNGGLSKFVCYPSYIFMH
jgi:hypothetical protein